MAESVITIIAQIRYTEHTGFDMFTSRIYIDKRRNDNGIFALEPFQGRPTIHKCSTDIESAKVFGKI